jgi:hypothetical protein
MTLPVMAAPWKGRRPRGRVRGVSLLGEIAPVWVSEGQVQPIGHIGNIALATKFVLDAVGGAR